MSNCSQRPYDKREVRLFHTLRPTSARHTEANPDPRYNSGLRPTDACLAAGDLSQPCSPLPSPPRVIGLGSEGLLFSKACAMPPPRVLSQGTQGTRMPPTRMHEPLQTVSALTDWEPSVGDSGDSAPAFLSLLVPSPLGPLGPCSLASQLVDVYMAEPGWQASCSAERSTDGSRPGACGFNASNGNDLVRVHPQQDQVSSREGMRAPVTGLQGPGHRSRAGADWTSSGSPEHPWDRPAHPRGRRVPHALCGKRGRSGLTGP